MMSGEMLKQLLHATIRLQTFSPDGSSGCGTGFFYLFERPGFKVLGIVTNKHVVEGADRALVHLTERGTDGLPVVGRHHQINFHNLNNSWVGHPDPDVDLCVIFFNAAIEHCESVGLPVYLKALEDSVLISDQELQDLSALEDVLMVGYPNGIWDSVNNVPILRRGVTATPPAIDYESRREFIIDAACFPGSSGSPVFLYNSGSWNTATGFSIGGERVKLLGLLYAGPQITAEGEVRVETIPTSQRVISSARVMINLGYVIKSSRVLEMYPVIEAALTAAAAVAAPPRTSSWMTDAPPAAPLPIWTSERAAQESQKRDSSAEN